MRADTTSRPRPAARTAAPGLPSEPALYFSSGWRDLVRALITWLRGSRSTGHVGPPVGGDVVEAGVLRALQSPHVEDDRPAVVDGDLGRVAHHGVEAVRDRVEQLAVRHGHHAGLGIDQVAGQPGAAQRLHALGDGAGAAAVVAVAGRAVDVVALVAAGEAGLGDVDLRRQAVQPLVVAAAGPAGMGQAAVEAVVGAQLTAGDGARDLGAAGAAVGEQLERGVGLRLG